MIFWKKIIEIKMKNKIAQVSFGKTYKVYRKKSASIECIVSQIIYRYITFFIEVK